MRDLRLLNKRMPLDPDLMYDFEQNLYATNTGTGLVLTTKPTVDANLTRATDKNFANRLFLPSIAAVEHGNGLSMEPVTINQFQRSEDFGHPYWTKIGSVISANNQIAPNGEFIAKLLEDDNGGGAPKIVGLDRTLTLPATGDWTVSIFVKVSDTIDWISIESANFDSTETTWFNIKTAIIGTQGHSNAGIENVDNGWQRIWVKFTTIDLTGDIKFHLVDDDLGITLATINGAQKMQIFGAQLENNAKPSTYIFTLGAISTRNKDTLVIAPVNITASVGTGYIRFKAGEQINDGNTYHLFSMGDGTAGNSFNRIYIRGSSVYMNVSGTERLLSRNEGVNPDEVIEVMWRWGLGTDLGIAAKFGSINGNITTFIISENTNISIPGGLGTLGMGIGSQYDDVNGSQPSGEILQIALWSTAKTDIEIDSIIFQPPVPPPAPETVEIDRADLTLTSLFVVVNPIPIDLGTLTLDGSFEIHVGDLLLELALLTLTSLEVTVLPLDSLDGGDAAAGAPSSTADGGFANQGAIINTFDGGDANGV